VRDVFVEPLESVVKYFLEQLKEGGSLHEVTKDEPGVVPQLEVLLMCCNNVREEAKKLGWWE